MCAMMSGCRHDPPPRRASSPANLSPSARVVQVPRSVVLSVHSMNIVLKTVGYILNVKVLGGVGLIVKLLIELIEVYCSGGCLYCLCKLK